MRGVNNTESRSSLTSAATKGILTRAGGNISGEELVRRYWEGAVRGGYIAHGETYLNDREELWWSKGGVLVGESPQRIKFLDEVMAAAPEGVLDPIRGDWDVPWGGAAGQYEVAYLGFGRPPATETLSAGPECSTGWMLLTPGI